MHGESFPIRAEDEFLYPTSMTTQGIPYRLSRAQTSTTKNVP